MLKEAIEKIVEISGIRTVDANGHTYSDVDLSEVRPTLDAPETYSLTSLDSLVKMIRAEAVGVYSAPLFVTVPSYDNAKCFTKVDTDKRYLRNILYSAFATDVPGWNSETKLPFEQAAIALQTRFQDTKDREYTLRLLSQITNGGKVTYNDNGVATTVVTQKGIALQGNETIKPIVVLKPYRTFQELDQPESKFLIRVDERGISFVEADGGMWKLAARQGIKKYLEEKLADMVETGTVVIAL